MSKATRIFVVIASIGAMIFAGYQLGTIAYGYLDADRTSEEIRDIADSPIEDDAGTEGELETIDAQFDIANYTRKLFGRAAPAKFPTSGNQTKSSIAKAQRRKINFKALKKVNKQIVAWVYIPNTNIEYAITKANNNSYYLKRDVRKRKSSSGSIFLDSKARADFEGLDAPIYGHHMKDGSMFGSMKNFKSKSYLKKHQTIFIYTPKTTKKYTIMNQFGTNSTKIAANKSKRKILTLVTCDYGRNKHHIVRAVLVSSKKPGRK
jgi:hypothetical protein